MSEDYVKELEVRGDPAPDTVIVAPERDAALKIEVRDALNRINTPTEDEAALSLDKPHILLRYITEEHHTFSGPRGYQQDMATGKYKLNPNFDADTAVRKALALREATFDNKPDNKAYLGVLCNVGEACLGQAVFASVILDQEDIPNQVVVLRRTTSPGYHAVVQYMDQEQQVQYMDPMQGTIVTEDHFGARYKDYAISHPIKEHTEKVKVEL